MTKKKQVQNKCKSLFNKKKSDETMIVKPFILKGVLPFS